MIHTIKDLTVEKYIELYTMDILDMEDIDIQANMISILTDLSVDEVMDLPLNEYRTYASQLEFLKDIKAKNSRVKKVKIDGREYKVIDKIDDMTAGQYIDYQTYIQKNDIKMLPYILSCLIIPKGEKYGDSDTIEDMKKISVEEALSISNFFTKRSQSLINGTLYFLEWKMKRKAKKMKDETMKEQMMEAVKRIHLLRNSIKSGVGFQALMQLPRQ